ncbi:MAG TPA: HAD family hydrolase [candidate division WOR-3 bacterium]|uniref:HAD family hydrolase n=1 Tax=candidate division WOR-3 bacterium TaxID=2052148 RepID=A0A9C9K0D5_UNCW3|nr:HAD family hydrolase [candidate division WOR-3 bacterium]
MIKAVIFDLDGTLYQSTVIREKFAEAAYLTLSRFQKITLADARKLIETRRDELGKKTGAGVPYTLVLKSFGVPIEFWHRENINYFDPRKYLSRDKRLIESLVRLKEQYKLAVLTNNNLVQSERTLEALGITNLFCRIFTYNTYKLLKPDITFFKKAAEDLQVIPGECLFVGDRYDVDLEPALSLGMKIRHVKGPEDIYSLAV